MLEQMNMFGESSPPPAPRSSKRAIGRLWKLSCFGAVCTRSGCGALEPRMEVTPWSGFKKSGEGP